MAINKKRSGSDPVADAEALPPALYVVATPIGNLRDVTLRALDTLRSVDLIACEDTRHSLRLLSAYAIAKPLISCHGHNERERVAQVIQTLAADRAVAYVSDAGSPAISDPGSILVRAVVDAGYLVVPIPGPSALTALLSVGGMSGREFFFEGFLSPKSGKRRTRLRELLDMGCRFICYESVHRVRAVVAEIAALEPQRQLVVGREMTKMYEEFIRGSAAEVLHALEQRSIIKGEFALLVDEAKNG